MMDRALKERIIGAVVLVALVVLVVPVFLDGPPAEQQVLSERVPLPGQDESQTQTVVLDRNRTEPVPAGPSARNEPAAESPPAASASDTPAPAPETAAAQAETVTESPAPAEQAEEPAPAAESPSPAASSTGMFAVQLGSFSNRENAETLAADLRQKGFAAFLSQLSTSGGSLQRVRIGPLADREAAERVAAQLARAGYEGQVVPHP